jgi:hypothetical protein
MWRSLNQHNDVIGKIETHIGNIGIHFLLEKFCDGTIDNDKLVTLAGVSASTDSSRLAFG